MSDIKLFNLTQGKIKELKGKSIQIEKSLQSLIETNLESFLGVKFLAPEYSTGPKHGGRIDTLGIDENHCPVIIEYKRATNENVINQGLYYLDWLMDHKAEFELLVQKKYGANISENIEWTGTRLICIAGGYTKYDNYAVEQIPRNIELIMYKQYPEHLLLELVNAVSGGKANTHSNNKERKHLTVKQYHDKSNKVIKERFDTLRRFILNLGDDVQELELVYYYGYKRIRNFACIVVQSKTSTLLIYTKLDPKKVHLKEGFTRDVSNIGHHGTGDLEIRVRTEEDLEEAKILIQKSYELN